MSEKSDNRAQKAFKSVEAVAKAARAKVVAAQRNAAYENQKKRNEDLSREAKQLKREGMYNNQIAGKMGISESSVRVLLLMKIPGEV